MITKLRPLPWALGDCIMESSNRDSSIEDPVRVRLPSRLYLYLFDEVINRCKSQRVVFATQSLWTASGKSFNPTTRLYPLYRRTTDNILPEYKTMLFLKGVKEVHRLAFMAQTPDQRQGPFISVIGLPMVLFGLIEALYTSGMLSDCMLPERYVEYLNTLVKHHLVPARLDELTDITRQAELLLGDDDIGSAELVESVVKTLSDDIERTTPDTISQVPLIHPNDVISIIANASKEGYITPKVLTLNFHPNHEIVSGDIDILPDVSGLNGISRADIDGSVRVGVDFEEGYEETIGPMVTDLLDIVHTNRITPFQYYIDGSGVVYFRDKDDEDMILLNHCLMPWFIAYVKPDLTIPVDYPITYAELLYTETEELLLTVHGQIKSKSYYFNLPALSVVSPTLFNWMDGPRF